MSTSSFDAPFRELGLAIERDFRRAHHAEDAFGAIATEHVARAQLHEHFSLRELARWALSAPELPRQHDPAAEFGQPPITLWAGRHFFISALVWRSSTTTIHQHAFTGAFQVLHGSSVHARYSFAPQHWCNENIAFGALSCSAAERLGRGDVRTIEPSTRGIHALFHLQHPSVSLVVRTQNDQRFPLQYDYFPPGVAHTERHGDVQQQRARQVAHMLVRCEPEAAFEILSECFASLPASDLFHHLRSLVNASQLRLALQLLDALSPRFEGHAALVEAALRELDRQSFLTLRRDNVRDPELRYFLAILLNAPRREHALELARAAAPEREPADTIVKWLVGLTEVKLKLQAAGLPWEPNVFGLPEPDERSLGALRGVLAGTPAPADADLPFYKAVRNDRVFAPLFVES